jgi:hypothetical protein
MFAVIGYIVVEVQAGYTSYQRKNNHSCNDISEKVQEGIVDTYGAYHPDDYSC